MYALASLTPRQYIPAPGSQPQYLLTCFGTK
ncbi:hypothetical protein L917_00493 [Phytophthora nicotianae]|uniref:Uncharacterized protein n=1 Tax=Phytophthora nicotianae TaxID=4792 RepID=W2JYS3_PHYNI|nr:hypothetical protein L915_00517 [Phytophthora nicotianae]ETL77330.1 hypothetical protein L917_21729 [Phytophthora nicotianae]ETM03261.1 hypothetical protein L917_00493 [Phytophthora nicotianae]